MGAPTPASVLKVFVDPSKPQTAEATYDPKDNIVRVVASETWIVETTDKTLRPTDMFNASDGTNTIPIPANNYNIGLGALNMTCDKVSAKQHSDGPGVFEVEVSYYINQLPASTVKLSLKSVAYPQQAYFDKDNNPIVNAAGQSFDPALTKTYYDMKFVLSWQSYTPPPIAAMFAAQGQVNSDPVTITAGGFSQTFTERQLRLDEPTADFEQGGGNVLWSSALSFTARSDTFVDKLLNEGFAQLDGSNNLVAIADSNGDPINSPAMLDSSGHLLAFGATPVFLPFKVETEAAMTSIVAAAI